MRSIYRGESTSPTPTDADHLYSGRYRRFSRSILPDRRRLLGHALVWDGDDWFASGPAAEIASTVGAPFGSLLR